MFAVGSLLHAAGEVESFITTGEDSREIGRQLNEYRRYCAMADEVWSRGCRGKRQSTSWTIAEFADELAVHHNTVRRRVRRGAYPFVRCVTHANCRGGSRGCDLRANAAEASAWLSQQRKK
jgi:hypothetical protein